MQRIVIPVASRVIPVAINLAGRVFILIILCTDKKKYFEII